jgi:hypothetical protein
MLSLMVSSLLSECRIVRWFTLQGLKLIQISVILSDMSDSCLLQSFRSNSTSLCCYENYMDGVDYFIVMA